MKTFLKLIGSFAVVCAVILFVPRGVFAQGYGSISGTVTDATGTVVPAAVVTATQSGTGLMQRTTTSAEGTFVFPTLAPSVYNISARHAGFEAYTENGVELRADAAVTVNIVAQARQGNRDGHGERRNRPGGRDHRHARPQVIGAIAVNELPLNGRNAAALTEEVAGITIAPPAQADQGNTKTFPMVVTISANGTFVGQTNYMLDGGNNVDEYTNVNMPFPMPDSVQEFSIETNNYNAQYGQNAGGVVNIITKSGTSKYHGDLFEFVRNRDSERRRTTSPTAPRQCKPSGPAQAQPVWRHRRRTAGDSAPLPQQQDVRFLRISKDDQPRGCGLSINHPAHHCPGRRKLVRRSSGYKQPGVYR